MPKTATSFHTFLPFVVDLMRLSQQMLVADTKAIVAKMAYVFARKIHLFIIDHITSPMGCGRSPLARYGAFVAYNPVTTLLRLSSP